MQIEIDARIIHWVALAVEKKTIKFALAGVLLEVRDGFLWVVGTDAYRIHVYKKPMPGVKIGHVFLPTSIVTALPKCGGIVIGRGMAKTAEGANIYSWDHDSYSYQFPDWRMVIPSPDALGGTPMPSVHFRYLSDALKACSMCEAAATVQLYGGQNTLVLRAGSFLAAIIYHRQGVAMPDPFLPGK